MSYGHQRDARLAGRGPGPKGAPKRRIIRRWRNAGTGFRHAELDCGHEVRLTKGYAWREGATVPCGACPRNRRGR